MQAVQITKAQNKELINLPKVLSETAYNTIKWIAILTMVIDHIAYVFQDAFSAETVTAMRTIGRMSFPLFAFLLVECFYFTKNKCRHLIQIFVIALVSEVLFDVVNYGNYLVWDMQNVCFTLALGFAMIWLTKLPIEKVVKCLSERKWVLKFFSFFWKANVYGIACILAHCYLKTEFSYIGLLLIVFFNIGRNSKHRMAWTVWGMIIYVIFITPQFMFAFVALLDIAIIAYSLKATSSQPKCKLMPLEFLNYKPFKIAARWFYPAHLAVIVAVNITITSI